jgi:LuxR family maltose regulon positive regulatory protein
VADYLFEEVIGRQPGHVVRFLTRTAILDRFTAPLCDAVAGTADAAATIEVLERENLFLFALDENRRWFRYHHLFAQALRERLTAREPALVPVLHARAGEWFRQHGSPEEAMSHALAAGDTDGAIDAIAASWYPYLNSGRVATVRGWLTAIGDEAVQANPRAAHVAAWLAALSGDPATVRRLLPVIGSAADTGPLPDGMRSLRSSAVLLRPRSDPRASASCGSRRPPRWNWKTTRRRPGPRWPWPSTASACICPASQARANR